MQMVEHYTWAFLIYYIALHMLALDLRPMDGGEDIDLMLTIPIFRSILTDSMLAFFLSNQGRYKLGVRKVTQVHVSSTTGMLIAFLCSAILAIEFLAFATIGSDIEMVVVQNSVPLASREIVDF